MPKDSKDGSCRLGLCLERSRIMGDGSVRRDSQEELRFEIMEGPLGVREEWGIRLFWTCCEEEMNGNRRCVCRSCCCTVVESGIPRDDESLD